MRLSIIVTALFGTLAIAAPIAGKKKGGKGVWGESAGSAVGSMGDVVQGSSAAGKNAASSEAAAANKHELAVSSAACGFLSCAASSSAANKEGAAAASSSSSGTFQNVNPEISPDVSLDPNGDDS